MSKAKKPAPKPKGKATIIQADASQHVAGKFMQVDLKLIDPSKTNPRKHFDEAALKDLADSIGKRGVLSPILVRPVGKRYELVAGERRFRASKLAGLKDIPARVADLDDKAVLEVQVIENLQRTDLSPIEEAESYAKLVKSHGYTVEVLAARIGKSQSYVHKRMKLASLPVKAKDQLLKGTLPLSHALLLARIHPELQSEALAAFQWGSSGNIKSYAECEKVVLEKFMFRLANAPFDTKDTSYKGGACTTCPQRTGNERELFDDIKAPDICTNPKCFEGKVDTWWTTKANAGKPGKPLTVKQSRQIFPYDNDYIIGVEYVKLKDRTYDMPERETYESLVGKDVPLFYALTRNLKVVTLAKTSDVKEALKKSPKMKAYKKKKKAASASSGSTEEPITERSLERRVNDCMDQKRLEIVRAKLPTMDRDAFWRRLIADELDMGAGNPEDILRRRGIEFKHNDYKGIDKKLNELASTLNGPDLIALFIEIRDPFGFGNQSDEWDELFEIKKSELKKLATVEVKLAIQQEKEAAKALKKSAKAAPAPKTEPVAESEDDFEDVDEEIAELEEVEE